MYFSFIFNLLYLNYTIEEEETLILFYHSYQLKIFFKWTFFFYFIIVTFHFIIIISPSVRRVEIDSYFISGFFNVRNEISSLRDVSLRDVSLRDVWWWLIVDVVFSRLTNVNIVHKPPEWTLIAVVLLLA